MIIDFSKLQRCFYLRDAFAMLNDATAALMATRCEVNQSSCLLEELIPIKVV